MKRAVILVLCALASVARADDRQEKRELVAQFLRAIDAQQFARRCFDLSLFAPMLKVSEGTSESARESINEWVDKLQTRTYARIDFGDFAEKSYGPIIDREFTSAELRELIAFAKTPAGRKLIAAIPDLTIEVAAKDTSVSDAVEEVSKELQDEELAKHPSEKTAAVMREIGQLLEAYRADNDEYPSDLRTVLTSDEQERDGWGRELRYAVSFDRRHYRLVSGGEDGIVEWDSTRVEAGDPRQPALRAAAVNYDDIIIQDQIFIHVGATPPAPPPPPP